MSASIVIPKLGMAMSEATLGRWLMGEGDRVTKGDLVLAIETEKITHEVEAPAEGILHIVVPEGTTLPCGEVCAVLASTVEEYQSLLGGAPAAVQVAAVSADGGGPVSATIATGEKVKASPAAKRVAGELGVDLGLVVGTGPDGRITEDNVRAFATQKEAPSAAPDRFAVSPLARKIADGHGVDITSVQGTGPSGRIVKTDVLAAIDSKPVTASDTVSSDGQAPAIGERRVARTLPLTGLRKTIAERMWSSIQNTAQLSASIEVDATELVRLRQQLVASVDRLKVRVTYNDFIARALVIALREHTIFNSSLEHNEIKIFQNVNLGIAVNLDEGLIVPVVHNVDRLSFLELSKAIGVVVDKARNRKLTYDDMTGGTITLSNVGNFPLVSFTPIINPPESAILGVGGIVDRPAVVNGQLAIRSMMTLSLTWDHRVADGVPASQLTMTLKELLENPSILLL